MMELVYLFISGLFLIGSRPLFDWGPFQLYFMCMLYTSDVLEHKWRASLKTIIFI